MGHLNSGKVSRVDKTPSEWLTVGAQINDVVNDWAGRSDIVTYVGPGAGHGAPACFVPLIAEMEINVDVAFDGSGPTLIPDLSERKNQLEYPKAMGAVLHEAMHARHSHPDLLIEINAHPDKRVQMIATMFEETRIEALGVKRFPKNRSFLRACALSIVLADLKEDTDFGKDGVLSFSRLILLTLARVDAGVLDAGDVAQIQEYADTLFDKKTFKALRKVWKKAQGIHVDYTAKKHLEYAEEWLRILDDAGHDTDPETAGDSIPEWLKELMQAMGGSGEGEPGESGESGESDESGESGEGESKDGKDGKGSGEEPSEESILEAMARSAEASANAEANTDYINEIHDAINERKKEEAAERSTHVRTGTEVYGRGTGPGGTSTWSTLIKSRPPSPKERAAAVALGKALDKAQYRDRVQIKSTSVIPPGRLNSRRAVAASEQKSRGVQVTSEAWSRKMRKHTEDPTLTVGLMVDISGSMSSAMEPMASCAWIMSEAVRRVQGKVSSMYYGNDVFPVLKAGQHLDEVKVYEAADGTERFDKAFKALDGHLNLLNSSGARLLVIVSDFHYTGEEMSRTQHWIKRCHDAGVGVMVIPFGYDATAKAVIDGLGKKIELIGHDKTGGGITDAAYHIGQAAIRQLQNTSQ